MNYFPWLHDDEDPSFAWITQGPPALDVPEEVDLYKGLSSLRWFPSEVTFRLAEERGIEFTDSIPNTLNLIFVSERLRHFLQERAGARIEFLPIRIQDQKNRLVPELYYIMNLLDMVECVDLERSRFRRSEINPSMIFRFYLLALDESRIPKEAKLFRLKEKPDQFMIREDLAQEMVDADLNGMMFLDLEEFGKEWGRR